MCPKWEPDGDGQRQGSGPARITGAQREMKDPGLHGRVPDATAHSTDGAETDF